jgi:hypothetical protein
LWFLALHKIAELKPGLIQELLRSDTSGSKPEGLIRKEWTEEARALAAVAEEQIETDPKRAAQTAEQIFSLGMIDWVGFLTRLNKRDPVEAQRLAQIYIDRLRDSSVTPVLLWNLQRFVFLPEVPPTLREYYFQAFVVRLRRDIRPDASNREMEDDLSAARGLSRLAARYASPSQLEFDSLNLAFENAFKERSLPLPGPPVTRTVNMTTATQVSTDYAQEIKDEVARVAAIPDTYARNSAYQPLVLKAAANGDIGLAEEIAAKISDDALRRFISVQIYGPVIKKAISEADWSRAQTLAAKIADPLTRALAFDSIAQAMLTAKVNSQEVSDLYNAVIAKLYNEFATERTVKAILILAGSLSHVDREQGREAVKTFAYALNRLSNKDEVIEESPLEASLSTWMRRGNNALSPDEALNLPDLVTATFEEMASHDVDAALGVSLRINHHGLYAMSQLAVSKVLLKQSEKKAVAAESRKSLR